MKRIRKMSKDLAEFWVMGQTMRANGRVTLEPSSNKGFFLHVNGEVDIMVKASATPIHYKRDRDVSAWRFHFSRPEVDLLASAEAERAWVALVMGDNGCPEAGALISLDEFRQCVGCYGLSGAAITVREKSDHAFHVSGPVTRDRNHRVKVCKNRISTWRISSSIREVAA